VDRVCGQCEVDVSPMWYEGGEEAKRLCHQCFRRR
jgi:hypothetical protein